MRRRSGEHIGDRLAFIRGQSRYVHERLYLLTARCCDHAARVSMPDQYGRSWYAFERSFDRGYVGFK
jgi:hypothetical protein